MPYNESLARRIQEFLFDHGADFFEKKMFGGICFMVDQKMFCATHIDKKSEEDLLLCRVGEEAYERLLDEEYVIPMEFTGRSMKGYVYVLEQGFTKKKDLHKWLQRCMDYNPLAKASKKK